MILCFLETIWSFLHYPASFDIPMVGVCSFFWPCLKHAEVLCPGLELAPPTVTTLSPLTTGLPGNSPVIGVEHEDSLRKELDSPCHLLQFSSLLQISP